MFKKGITLISLVITVIVLLILAGVAINIAVNSNGLFNKTEEAANKWNASVAEEGSALNDIIGQIDNYITVDWDAILADATSNPNKYKHPEQSSTNGDIGIGTDGKPVNLDLWTYEVINTNEILLSKSNGCGYLPGYNNSNITEDGKIQGTVPQYIKKDGQTEFYPVTNMEYTFDSCTNLITAPVIPDTVTNMWGTFYSCSKLEIAPTIPNGVTNMSYAFFECIALTTAPFIPNGVTNMSHAFYKCIALTTAPFISNGVTNMSAAFYECTALANAPELPSTVEDIRSAFEGCTKLTTPPRTIPSSVSKMETAFYNCSKLTGEIEINTNTTVNVNCFKGAATAAGTNLIVTGSSTQLDEIIATKSANSNITKGT